MPIDQIVTCTAHLQRTSETDQVPAAWAAAEIQRVLMALPETERASAMLTGWMGARIEYQHRRSDLEVAQELVALLKQALRAHEATGMTSEQVATLVAQMG
jgi:hypothetical protein